jgi:pyruvate, water dikinase
MTIVWFDDYVDADAPRVGGKCASLGAMTRAGLPVPAGFAVATDAFTASMERNAVGARIHGDLAGLEVRDLAKLADAAHAARRDIRDSGPAPQVEDAIRAAYRELCRRTGVHEVPFAVRSSANAEDQPDASFAGQQDTYLWIRGGDEVVNQVVRCWASLYTDRAIAYRHEKGYAHEQVAMSVAVQQMVLPRAAGVAFTLNPTNGDRSKVVIDSAFGLGESVVSGEVPPDNLVFQKAGSCTVVTRALPDDRAGEPSLTDDDVRAVARLARQCEKHFGRPQDVEWAVVDAPTGVVVHLLQSRPETVWSNKPRPSVSQGVGSPMDGIVATLLTPIRVKPQQ